MLNKRSTFTQTFNNRKGQVALFIALAFQILFLFFAMVINVGLLVHHKINLQNSVDLAAYYGAMKQAENMNAIAHINYQIRQSWKLLAWRYRMLGTAGEFDAHPFKKDRKQLDMSMTGDVLDATNSNYRNWQIAPAFCITYIPFKPMPPGENTCKSVAENTPVKLWATPPLIAGHQVFSSVIRAASDAMIASADERCVYFGSYNYMMLAKFIVAFNIDQGDRMAMMAALSRATSMSKEDFFDLDGGSVKTGIERTLLNNLTSANRATARMDVFNSLGADGCNAQGLAEGQPAKWLTPVKIYPGFRYVDTQCNNKEIKPIQKELTGDESTSFPEHRDRVPDIYNIIKEYAKFIGYRQNLNDNYNFSIGVEKNPWCMAYMGVSATATPKIPFSPFGSVTLKARAFYKPFGGRMGPWYYKMWKRGSSMSEGGPNDKTDPNLPPRVSDTAQLATISQAAENNEIRVANFSRFIGDTLGLKSYKMLGYYGQAIYNLDAGWRNNTAPKDDDVSIYKGDDAPNFAHWDHLPFKFVEQGGSGDVLAWDSKNDRPSKMRILETAAILPDNFDIAYYSIEPDFYHNYYQRIRDGYLRGPGKDFNKVFRPDIGYRRGFSQGSYDLEKFSIKDQYEVIKDPGDVVDMKGIINSQFTFTTEDWRHALTSWAPKGFLDYSLDEGKFGKCSALPVGADKNDPAPPTSGNCVVGGTTGYSVKMISSDYLRSSELQLGGENGGSGPLLNPPPDDSEF